MDIFNGSVLEDGLNRLKQITKKPEHFLGVQEEVGKELKHLLKNLYDYTKRSECVSSSNFSNGSALPELVIKHFDEEQIWQELELQNDDICNRFISDVSQLVARKDKVNFNHSLNSNDNINQRNGKSSIKSDHSFESGNSGDEYLSDRLKSIDEEEEEELVEEESEGPKPEDVEAVESKSKGKIKTKPSVVDDKFFKLQDLERYLDREDRKENQHNKKRATGIDEGDDDDDESIDYFQDTLSDEEDEENEGGGTDMYYKDFFDPPDEDDNVERRVVVSKTAEGEEPRSDEEEEEEDESDTDKKSDGKQVRFNLLPASSGSDSSESEDEVQTDVKSSFEARQERLKTRIEQLEEKALAEKPWQLKGEVSAAARPQNSLLEEIVEFDLTTRPAPVITEQTTLKLEDIIRQRIKDKVWDDVERKVKPVKAPDEYKKQLVMDQEKSKLSLAEVYEQEYIKQREAQNPSNQEKPEEEPKEHQEVRAMMSALFAKLDALSNFHYTPKPVAPEIKVISNLPAISMEEVAPVAASDANLLAPEEVKAKLKGDLIGKAERTKTDKKRERRHKKAMQRQRHKERENRVKTVEKLKPGLGNKYSKERALQMLETVTKDKNVEQMVDMGKDKGVRSSTAFFARLQEEVTSHIKARTEPDKRKKLKNSISAKKIKL
ncbi:U3 small nucleolar ribonucleoprotein protein MPP10 [Anabrus simplex]|uniref:U3 small nucleolar ribonucleoprotein protein MPP10 n=1 Tax=Anabrus simplex TaxID=316456 RepID=UPI0035A36A3F